MATAAPVPRAGQDGAEQIGALVALILGLARPGAGACPLPYQAVLLAQTHLVLPPDLDRCGGRQVGCRRSQRAREVFFERLQNLGILVRMTRSGTDERKAEIVQQARDRSLVIVHPEAVADHRFEVDPAPPHHAVGLRIGAGFHQRRQFRLLGHRQLRNRARRLSVVQALRAFRVETMHPVAQALAIHAANCSRLGRLIPS